MTASFPAGLAPGFADPALAAQASFRAALTALSEPGCLVALGHGLAPPPPPLGPAAAALALTLLDHDTPLWLSPALRPAAAYLRFHCGCPPAAGPEAARFAVVTAAELPPLAVFAAGSDDYPDHSATVIVEVAGLRAGGPLVLSGPGIADRATLAADGLPADFLACWAANRGRFPRGVDLLLTCGPLLCGLPRTTLVGG